MTLIPYKTFNFETALTKAEVMDRLKVQAEFSKTKGFLAASTDDFLLETKAIGNAIFIRSKFEGRRIFQSKIIVTFPENPKTIVKVRLTPRIGGILFCIPIVLLILFIPSSLTLKVSLLGLIYLLGMLGFGFDIWWTKYLFKKKLLNI